MSYSSSRRRVLDPNRSLAYRACCLRSCALLTSRWVGLTRNPWIERIRDTIGIDLHALANEEELIVAFRYIDAVRTQALNAAAASGMIPVYERGG